MRVLIAPDSFKGSLSAAEAAAAMAAGWHAARPDDEVNCVPMADGGEGTVEALVQATGGEYSFAKVSGPLGGMVQARYGWLGMQAEGSKGVPPLIGDGQDARPPLRRCAVIEMAAAAGLALVPEAQRNPRLSTTRGVGELIAHALDAGSECILIGLGGSATNDGGAGMAQTLGYRLLDKHGRELEAGGEALLQLERIDCDKPHPLLANCEIQAICDVDNPLCGARGASAVYGPQKGASPVDVEVLDAALAHFADIIQRDLGMAVRDVPGAGAAGGLGAGLLAFAHAKLCPGFPLIAEMCNLAQRMRGVDIVLTGEGSLDAQTLHGKTPLGVLRLARENGVARVYAFAGRLGAGHEELGFDGCFEIGEGMDARESMEQAKELLETRVREFAQSR